MKLHIIGAKNCVSCHIVKMFLDSHNVKYDFCFLEDVQKAKIDTYKEIFGIDNKFVSFPIILKDNKILKVEELSKIIKE